MGVKGIVERYMQIRPKVLFIESQTLYGGKTRDFREKLRKVVGELKKRINGPEKVVISGPTWDDGGL